MVLRVQTYMGGSGLFWNLTDAHFIIGHVNRKVR